ncbi:putative RNA-directed DNA polymerase from transposon X-element [Trichonephila clavipes]|nr:putative RNA-directed DNA polymerase from transposon X-element [Trichonephila clavipes]
MKIHHQIVGLIIRLRNSIWDANMIHNTRVVQISNKSFPPWWNGTCHNFYKLKKKFRKKAIRSISPQLWIKYKQYASKLRFHIKNAKRLYWDNICNNVSNPKIFFNILKKLSNTKKIEPKYNILQVNNRYITQPQIQANIFADFFASKNAYHEPIPLDFFHKEDNNLNKPFHIFEIHRAIKLSKNSTPGADHITASFLKNLDRNGCEIILRYFQDLFDNAIVPNSWKHAVILPIPKQCKDKTCISSYRPIALTSVFSKTFERVLTNRLSYFLTTERKLHPQHYGFVPFKDSRSATYLIHKAIMDAKLKKKYFVGDKSLPVQIIRGLFDETVNRNFQDFYIIATDASKNEQITSIADYWMYSLEILFADSLNGVEIRCKMVFTKIDPK